MKNYELGTDENGEPIRQQLGKLFVERNCRLLKNGGVLSIILPNGYLTNKTDIQFRNFIFDNFRVVAIIELPEHVFKKSGAGGYTTLLILQKGKTDENYEIFTAEIKKIGFEHKRKNLPKLYKVDNKTGEKLLDVENRPIPDNDFIEVEKQFKYFSYKNSLDMFEKEATELKYCKVLRSEIEKNNSKILSAARYSNEYLNEVRNIKRGSFTTLKEIGAEISRQDKNLKFENSNDYEYIEIGDTFSGVYKSVKLKGWELPNRAKMTALENDIFVSSLSGCIDKYFIFIENKENVVVSNGFFRVRIPDKNDRLNFYRFLTTEQFLIQMYALKTGTILSTIDIDDFENNLLVPTNNKNENAKNTQIFIDGLKHLV